MESSRTSTGSLRVSAECFACAGHDDRPSDDASVVKEFDGAYIAAVADGLGSAKKGGEAATRAVETLARNFPARPRAWSAGKAVEEIMRHLNRRFHQEGIARFESTELATTCAVVVLEGDRLHALNLGDSRIRGVWNATQLKSEFFPDAFVPDDATARYYALEYIHAPTLKQYVAEHGPLAPTDAIELARLLLRAGQFLLGHDFVHGDLKPENILVLEKDGGLTFQLIDLGSVVEVFSMQGRAGTPSYLAPERFSGAAMTERTEIFSLGVTLYEALTGKLPYGEVEPFQQPVFHPARPLAAHNPHVPPWLEAILAHAITPDPERRYESYSEMLFELENPAKVRPFHRPGAPLLERNPLLFYKIGFFLMLAVTLTLVVLRLLGK